MRDLSVKLILAAALFCATAAPVWADYVDGLAAYLAGDYATALKEWRLAAEQGDASSATVTAVSFMVPLPVVETAYLNTRNDTSRW